MSGCGDNVIIAVQHLFSTGAEASGGQGDEGASWQAACNGLSERNLYLLETGTWHDCEFVVGNEEKKTFLAHRLVLASSSEVFEAMLLGPMQERKPIEVPDIRPEIFHAMLTYVYSGNNVLKLGKGNKMLGGSDPRKQSHSTTTNAKCEPAEQAANICHLYRAADKYMIACLKRECVTELEWISSETVIPVLELAAQYGETILLDMCWEHIAYSPTEVISGSSIEHVQKDTVLALVKYALDKSSVEDVFMMLWRWLKSECGRQKLEPTREHMQQVLGDILSQVYFSKVETYRSDR